MKQEIKNQIIENIRIDIPQIDTIKDKVAVETPKDEKLGDFSTNVAFLLAKVLKKHPLEIANQLQDRLQKLSIFSKVDVAGNGFINLFLSDEYYHHLLKEIVKLKEDYGRVKEGSKGKINIEFVSANPTGPLHLGHGRGAVVGRILSEIYSYSGYKVEREFYINDAGNQIKKLGQSIYARFRQIEQPSYPFPEDGYHGDYIKDIAKELYVIEREKILSMLSEDDAVEFCANYGKNYLLEKIKEDLKMIEVEFDIWFSEKHLYEHGKVEEAIEYLKSKGMVYEKDDALWLKTTIYGDDKDRVIRKSDGSYTYFAGDIAYHFDKYKRGYDFIINIWGADHHGYLPRLKSAIMSFEVAENWINVLFIQLVKLFKNGEEVKMSKRSGEFITLRELVEEVGKDPVIYFFASKDSDTPLNFDIDVALAKNSENPVYYVQYAYARICSVFKEAKIKLSFDPEEEFDADLSLLNQDIEKSIVKYISAIPDMIYEAASKNQPHKIPLITYELASKFHRYYYSYKFLDRDNIEITYARLYLLKAVRNILKLLFKLMGITALERM